MFASALPVSANYMWNFTVSILTTDRSSAGPTFAYGLNISILGRMCITYAIQEGHNPNGIFIIHNQLKIGACPYW